MINNKVKTRYTNVIFNQYFLLLYGMLLFFRVLFCNSLGCNDKRVPWSEPVVELEKQTKHFKPSMAEPKAAGFPAQTTKRPTARSTTTKSTTATTTFTTTTTTTTITTTTATTTTTTSIASTTTSTTTMAFAKTTKSSTTRETSTSVSSTTADSLRERDRTRKEEGDGFSTKISDLLELMKKIRKLKFLMEEESTDTENSTDIPSENLKEVSTNRLTPKAANNFKDILQVLEPDIQKQVLDITNSDLKTGQRPILLIVPPSKNQRPSNEVLKNTGSSGFGTRLVNEELNKFNSNFGFPTTSVGFQPSPQNAQMNPQSFPILNTDIFQTSSSKQPLDRVGDVRINPGPNFVIGPMQPNPTSNLNRMPQVPSNRELIEEIVRLRMKTSTTSTTTKTTTTTTKSTTTITTTSTSSTTTATKRKSFINELMDAVRTARDQKDLEDLIMQNDGIRRVVVMPKLQEEERSLIELFKFFGGDRKTNRPFIPRPEFDQKETVRNGFMLAESSDFLPTPLPPLKPNKKTRDSRVCECNCNCPSVICPEFSDSTKTRCTLHIYTLVMLIVIFY